MLTQSKPTHLKARPLKMNGTPLLLKWLVAFCVLDGVAASEFEAIANPDLNPSPAPEPTCGCAAEIELMSTQLWTEFRAMLEALSPNPSPPTCDTDLFEQPGAPNHCACGEESIFNIDKAKVHLGDCCVTNSHSDVVSFLSGRPFLTACADSSKCCINAAEIPVYTLGLAARQDAEMSFATSLENYVPSGSRYDT